MRNLLAEYGETNPEKFNESLIYGKENIDVERNATELFHMLEVIDGIKVNQVKVVDDEESLKPILKQDAMYKTVMQSHMSRIHYSVSIDGYAKPIEGDMNILKIIDRQYFINEGVRYFPIWQLTPVFSYHTKNGISLKTLMLPVTVIKGRDASEYPEFGKPSVDKVPVYDALIFGKSIPMLWYYMSSFAMDSLKKSGHDILKDSAAFQAYTDPSILKSFIDLFGLDLKVSDDASSLNEEGRLIFSQKDGVSFSLPEADCHTPIGKFLIEMMLETADEKKRPVSFTKKDMETPWFWVCGLSKFFVTQTDCLKRWTKVKGVYVSLGKIVDNITRENMPIPSEDKSDIFHLMKYVVEKFPELMQRGNSDYKYLQLSLYEFILYPLRVYLSRKVNQLLNQQTITVDDKVKIFSKLSPMYLIRSLVRSKLLRPYNVSSELSLFSNLDATIASPQSMSSNVPVESRDVNETMVGRVSLTRSSPSNPGLVSTLTPFVNVYGPSRTFRNFKSK